MEIGQSFSCPSLLYTFSLEISIYLKVPFVKNVVLKEKICYTCAMNTSNQASTTQQPETCATHPVGRALRLLGDVSTLLIVYTLLTGTKRFGELLEAIGNISSKTL